MVYKILAEIQVASFDGTDWYVACCVWGLMGSVSECFEEGEVEE